MSNPDLSEFSKYASGRRRRCGVAKALNALSADDAQALTAALAEDPLDIPAGSISTWLKVRKIDVSHNYVGSHRRKTCSCYD